MTDVSGNQTPLWPCSQSHQFRRRTYRPLVLVVSSQRPSLLQIYEYCKKHHAFDIGIKRDVIFDCVDAILGANLIQFWAGGTETPIPQRYFLHQNDTNPHQVAGRDPTCMADALLPLWFVRQVRLLMYEN